jgi:hypothetical protein
VLPSKQVGITCSSYLNNAIRLATNCKSFSVLFRDSLASIIAPALTEKEPSLGIRLYQFINNNRRKLNLFQRIVTLFQMEIHNPFRYIHYLLYPSFFSQELTLTST